MRILTVLESPSWVEHHIAGSLEEMGHTIHRFHYGEYVGEFYGRSRRDERERKNKQLIRLANSLLHGEGLDLIFCYVYDDFLIPEYAKLLADLDVPMVNFNVDMVNQWYRQTRTAKYFTKILCAQRINIKEISRYGAKTMYFPMAARLQCNQKVAQKNWLPAAPVTFIGTPQPYRAEVLQRLNKEGVYLAIYGKYWKEHRQAAPNHNWEKTLSDMYNYGWPRFQAEGLNGLTRAMIDRFPNPNNQDNDQLENELPSALINGFVPNNAMSSLFKNSKINLGFTRMIGDNPDTKGVNQVKLRDFEVPMAGGFYLVEKAPDYDSLFKPGVEIETWSSVGELLDKIHYYLEHDKERETIAKAAAVRAKADHTWERRFQSLFYELGINS